MSPARPLTRRLLLGAGFALPLLPARARAAGGSFDYGLKPEPVADGIWAFIGATEHFTEANGGNIQNTLAIAAPEGVIIVDAGTTLRYGQQMRQAVEALLPGRPIAAVLLTHDHPDHCFGTGGFAPAPILSLPGTAQALHSNRRMYSDSLYRLLGDWMRGTDPQDAEGSLQAGPMTLAGRRLTLLALGGHTAADLAILDEQTGTLIAGDLIFHDRAPTMPHAVLPRWLESLTTLQGLSPARIVPGHGPVESGWTGLTQTQAYLLWLTDRLNQAAAQGLTDLEAAALPLPPEFAALGANPAEYARSVSQLYPSWERLTWPERTL